MPMLKIGVWITGGLEMVVNTSSFYCTYRGVVEVDEFGVIMLVLCTYVQV
jgi:hypothetical protein